MKTKAVLIAALFAVCFGSAFSQQSAGRSLRRPRQQRQDVSNQNERRLSGQGVPGVTAPLIPFEEKDKIKYEDAVERAKNNDAEAFYWLAYYFAKGENVTHDRGASGKFLQRAADVGSAKANYLIALHHEWFTLKGADGTFLGNNYGSSDELKGLSYYALIGLQPLIDMDSFRKPEAPKGVSAAQWYCCTNEIVSQFVVDLYSAAVNGGLVYATNDIARLKQTIAKCRERIALENAAQVNSEAALKLLREGDSKKSGAREREQQEEERKQEREECERQREYWSTWPGRLEGEAYNRLIADFEEKFNCMYLKQQYARPVLGRSVLGRSSVVNVATNTWKSGEGKCLVVERDPWFSKFDADGKIVACGLIENRSDLEEFKWYDDETTRRLDELRAKWAEGRGMSLEEATRKHDEYCQTSGPRLLGSLRERRAARAAEAEKERAAREAEREAQRMELQQLKDELRAQREAAEAECAAREVEPAARQGLQNDQE